MLRMGELGTVVTAIVFLGCARAFLFSRAFIRRKSFMRCKINFLATKNLDDGTVAPFGQRKRPARSRPFLSHVG